MTFWLFSSALLFHTSRPFFLRVVLLFLFRVSVFALNESFVFALKLLLSVISLLLCTVGLSLLVLGSGCVSALWWPLCFWFIVASVFRFCWAPSREA